MILRQVYYLEEETTIKIRKEQQNRDSWAIDDWEYEDRFEAIMQRYRMETELIMAYKKPVSL